MAYRVELTPRADRDLGGLAPDVRTRIEAKIAALAETPRPAGVVKLQGAEVVWRIRVGDYRVLFEIDDAAQAVRIDRVRHRSDAYR